MHNNYFFLKHLASELDVQLKGARVVSVNSMYNEEVQLWFEKNNQFHFLRLYLHPQFNCLSFWEDKFYQDKAIVSDYESAFQLKVLKIGVLTYDRAIRIQLANDHDLILKMYGTRSNLLLLKNDKVEAIFNTKLVNDFQFDLKKIECQNTNQDFENILNKTLANRDLNLITKEQYLNQLQLGQYSIIRSEKHFFELSLFNENDSLYFFKNAIEALNQFFVLYVSELQFVEEKERALSVLQKNIVKTEKYIQSQHVKLKYLQESTPPEQVADVIMANIYQITHSPVERMLSLLNFYNNEMIEVKFKRNQSPQKLAEGYYKKAKNRKKEFDAVLENIENREEFLNELKSKYANLEQCDDTKQLSQLIKKYQLDVKKLKKEEETIHFKQIMIMDFVIYIGKNAQNNDLLLKNHTFKDDLWFHAKDTSGSHLIIKHQAGKVFPKLLLEKVASIAAWHSHRRTDSLCPVIVTSRKYVHKPKGAAPGMVRVLKEEQILLVKPEKWEGE